MRLLFRRHLSDYLNCYQELMWWFWVPAPSVWLQKKLRGWVWCRFTKHLPTIRKALTMAWGALGIQSCTHGVPALPMGASGWLRRQTCKWIILDLWDELPRRSAHCAIGALGTRCQGNSTRTLYSPQNGLDEAGAVYLLALGWWQPCSFYG